LNPRYTLPVAMLCIAGATAPAPAFAGPYADEMAKCFVRESAPADRTMFIRWMFSAMALHPEVQAMAKVSDAQREEVSKGTAQIFQKLVLESCRKETQQAIKFEGSQTIAYGFQLLGQVAARELFTNQAVAGGLSSLAKYFDEKKLKALTDEATGSAGTAPAAGQAPAAEPAAGSTPKP